MTALIGALRVSLSADTANFEAGMRRAQRASKTSASEIEKSLGKVKAGIAGFAAGITVGMFTKAIGNALEYAGSLAEVAQQLGVTAKDLQVFRFAAGQVGVSQDQLETGLSKLTITLGKVAAGAEAPTKALKAIGISADQIKGKDTGEAFRIIADGLQKVTDRSQRAAVEVALFGKTGSMLDNLLSGGSRQINELSQAAEKLGIVLSDEQIQHADETADKLRAVKTVLEAQIASTVAKNADSILALASSLGTLSGEIVKFLNSNPQLALGIVGALLGGRVGGLPGAAVGAIGGIALGNKLSQNMANGNMDPAFRRQQFIKAETAFQRSRQQGDLGGRATPGIGTPLNDTKALKAERDRQAKLYYDAVVASKRPKSSTPTGVNVPQFLAIGGGGGGGGAKSARPDHSEVDALRDQQQFNQDLRRAQMDVLQAKRDLAHSSDEQAKLDLQMLDLQKQDQDEELNYQVALNKATKGKQGLTEEQAKQLKIEYDKTDALKRQEIADKLASEKAQERAQLLDNNYDIQIEELQNESDLAQTAKEKREAELRILDVMKQQEKARLEAVLADKDSTDLAKKEAQARLDALDKIYKGRAASVENGTKGPLQSYLDELPTTAEKWNEALQNVAVDGLKSIEDGLLDILDGTKSVAHAFRDMAQSIIRDLLKIAIRRFITAPLAKALFGGFSEGGLAGYATGGRIFGAGTGTSDSIPAMLSNGEFVVNAKSTKKFLPLLETINSGRASELARGGLPMPKFSPRRIADLAPALAGGSAFHFNVTVNGAMSDASARRTGMQIAAGAQAEIARSKVKGFGG